MEHKEYYITEALANDLKMTLGEKCDPDLRKSLDNLILTKNNMTPRADSSVSTSGWVSFKVLNLDDDLIIRVDSKIPIARQNFPLHQIELLI